MPWWRRRDRGPELPPGWPDLRRYRKSASFYHELYLEGRRERGDWDKRVTAQWGLIARGRDSIPFLQQMLASRDPASREDAAGAFEAIGESDPDVVRWLVDALEAESEDQPRDSIILALGNLRSRAAIPALASVIRDEEADGDTRSCAAESLGRIVRRRFGRQPDPIAAATAWLDAQPGGAD